LGKKKIIRIFEIFLVVVGIQTIFSIYFFPHIVPCFLLVFLLNLVWDGESEISLFLAFVSGIIYDTLNKAVIGLSSAIFLVIVYINSFYRVRSFFVKNLLIFVFSMVYFLILPLKAGEGFMWNKPVIIKYSFIFAFINLIVEYFIYTGKTMKWKGKNFFIT